MIRRSPHLWAHAEERLKLLFLHIPKTAGTSLIRHLAAHVGEEKVFARQAFGPALPEPEEEPRYDLIAGHLSVREVRHLLGSRFSFTFLRDPLDLAMSKYHYYRELRDERVARLDPEVGLAQRLDLADCIERAAAQEWSCYENQQTAYLAGLPTTSATPAELLAAAKRNLEALSFFGLYEALEESLERLHAACGWPRAAPLRHLNRTGSRPALADLDAATRDRLIRMNPLDLELLDHARRVFAARGSDPLAHRQTFAPAPDAGRRELGDGRCEIVAASIQPTAGAGELTSGRCAAVLLELRARQDCPDLVLGISIADRDGRVAYGVNSAILGQHLEARAGEVLRACFLLDLQLPPADYSLTVAAHGHDRRSYHWIENASTFAVHPAGELRFDGTRDCRASLSVQPAMRTAPLPAPARALLAVRPLGALDSLALDPDGRLPVVVENLSDQWISSQPPAPLYLSYHLLDPVTRELAVFDGLRTPLLPALPPRARAVHRLQLDRSRAGRFLVLVSMVQEGVAWLEPAGGYEEATIRIE